MDDLRGIASAVAIGAPCKFPAKERRRNRRERFVRSAATAASVVLLGVAAVGPYAWHTARVRAAATSRSLIADSVDYAIRAAAGARAEREDLEAISSFLSSSEERRLAMLAFVEALPSGAALAALRVDATGVTATVVAPESLDVLDAIARSTALQDVVPIGGLSSESRDGARFQRVVVTARRSLGSEGTDEP
ncbi:MAG: hypothetical protein KF709_12640 [Gemmatimonadaceae bacterium]|nr:hypothetical protein [Gemmatimonadaceae bacterium]